MGQLGQRLEGGQMGWGMVARVRRGTEVVGEIGRGWKGGRQGREREVGDGRGADEVG